MSYVPKSALKKFAESGGLKGKPVGRRVGPAYDIKARGSFCCFPLRAWTEQADALPEDIKAIPLTAAALKAHQRPDGSVYLGAFEAPDDTESTIVVFGDAMTSHDVAVQVSIEFRRRLWRLVEAQAADHPPRPELVQ